MWFVAAMLLAGQANAQHSRVDVQEYEDNLDLWAIGQLRSSTNVDTGLPESHADYDSATALPIRVHAFGKLQQTMTYRADGTLATVRDGNGHATTLSAYKRGIPQATVHADGTTRTVAVDDFGQIVRAVDENGHATRYTYDAMGRLAGVAYPEGDTTSPWNATTNVFEPIASSEYGIAAGHWRQTISTGHGRRELFFDAFWRPLLVREYDTADVCGTQRFTAFAYDADGRRIFASYPTTSVSAVASVTHGTRTVYDALGRATRSTQDSELGPLTTTTGYLASGQARVIDSRGQVTLTHYLRYDTPSDALPIRIDQPEGVRTDIARDVFGKPISVTRTGPGG
jgi:YD repeat-containing protein